MRRNPSAVVALSALLAAGALLSACAESRLREADDFGDAARADRVGQIADPDAHYAGTPSPGANGMRVDAAEERYVQGKVEQPESPETSQISSATGGSGGSNGGGGGGGTPTAGQ